MKKELKNTEICVVANGKGGVGKSTFSTQILPILSDKSAINIYEIDDNNKTILPNSKINFRTIKITHAEDAIDDVSFDLEVNNDVLNIIDCGGGNDTFSVLQKIKENGMFGLKYFVPVNDDIEQFTNAKETIEAIKKDDPTSKVYLVFNRVLSDNVESVKKQFIAFFGDDDFGIEGKFDQISHLVDDTFFVKNSTIFGLLKNYHGQTIFDAVPYAKDLCDNIEKYKKEWTSQGKEEYRRQLKIWRFAKSVLELRDELSVIKKALKD